MSDVKACWGDRVCIHKYVLLVTKPSVLPLMECPVYNFRNLGQTMSPARWNQIEKLYHSALNIEPGRRTAYLAAACQGDEGLRRQIERLLAQDGSLFDQPAWEAAPSLLDPEERTPTAGASIGPAPEPIHSGGERLLDDATILKFGRPVAGRFRVLARLGGGGFGDVYRVADEAAGGGQFALKILRSSDPLALQNFKREFRSLAHVRHPNIIVLHELIAHEGRWMFSMDFVEGVDLLRFLASHRIPDHLDALHRCFRQLAEGVRALHDHNLLHRDLKPSNVLVTSTGQLIILDFGLVRPFGDDLQETLTFAGTPHYMSPEQFAGAALGEPSDWYAVGVMLYQVLTGELPFKDRDLELLRRKKVGRPLPPIELDHNAPLELSDLCMRLLEPDPVRRASYEEVIRLVSPEGGAQVREAVRSPFVGREASLRVLYESYAVAENSPVLVHLSGPSGIGKTVLLREFMLGVASRPSTMVFAGRCYEGESVPFQAIDDLIDNIGQHLRRLPRERVDQFLPRNFMALVTMFPVLSRFLSGVQVNPARHRSTDLRTLAFGALREMLGRFAERHRVVIIIDDLQWGDADGCAALNELLSFSDSPPMLVVLAYRTEDIETSPWLKTLRETAAQPAGAKSVFVQLDSLETREATELATALLAERVNPATLQHVVEQSGGNPFLVHEIVRWINTRANGTFPAGRFSLADVVRSRVAGLAIESRRMLELLAVAGQPTGLAILQAASGVEHGMAPRDELVAARLVRSRMVQGHEEIELYHERLRVTILMDLEPTTVVVRHRELAFAMAAAEGHDPERIAAHFAQAHEPELCARYALQAARRAVQVLAFHKASSFFEMALSTQTLPPGDRRAVHRECADALANAGLASAAAEHYLAASEAAGIDESLEGHLRAAEQLLFSGRVDRGLEIFENVLEQVGVQLPKSPSRFPVVLLMRRAHLRMRGLRFREVEPARVPRRVLLRIDTCASVATGLSLVDIARGAALQTTSLLLALQAGEPSRIARALAMEAAYISTAGVKMQSRAGQVLKLAGEWAARTGDQHAAGLTAVMAAACAWNAGRWEECYRLARLARETLGNLYERLVWERDTASIFEVDGLRWMGRWSVMKAILPGLLEDARHRGDLYVQAILQMHGGSCAELANDDPEAALAGLAILEQWSNTGFHVEHLVELHNQVERALYVGKGKEAMNLVTRRWPALRQSLLLRVQPFHIQMRSLCARAALSAALEEKSTVKRRELLRVADREARAIEKQHAPWGLALAELIRGGRESALGRPQAIASFERAEAAADSAGMFLHANVARRARALLMGGNEGRQLRIKADANLSQESIRNPERLTALIAPGVIAIS